MLKEEKEEKYCHKTETKQLHFIFFYFSESVLAYLVEIALLKGVGGLVG